VHADLRRSDTANYACWAASETGVTRSRTARLSVDAPSSGAVVFHRSPRPDTFPAPPGRPSAGQVTNTTVTLAWRAPGNAGTSPLLGYAVEYFSHVIGQVPVCVNRNRFMLKPTSVTPVPHKPHPSGLKDSHHRSSGDCLEGKEENYQVCSVQYCVQQLCTVRCTHI